MKVIFENWRKYLDEAPKAKKQEEPLLKVLEQAINQLEIDSKYPYMFFDTETMGFSAQYDQITQLALAIVEKRGQEKATLREQDITIKLTEETEKKIKIKQKWLETIDNDKRLPEEKPLELKWLDREEPEDIQQDDTESKETEQKKSDEEKEKEKKYVNLNWLIYKKEKEKIDLNDKKYNQKLQALKDRIFFMLKYTKWDKQKANTTEEETLKIFANEISKRQNYILVAHNASFDVRMINERSKLYGLEPPIVVGQTFVREIKDTLSLIKKLYIPTLQELEKKVDDLLKEMDSGIKEADDSKERLTPDQIKDLSKQTISSYGNLDLLAKRKLMLETLQQAIKNTKPETNKLGSIATTFKIDPTNAHNAMEDVRMLVDIFFEINQILKFAYNFLKTGEIVLSEVNKFQEKSKKRRKRQLQILLKHGGNKDKLFKKGNLKTGKSAPPGLSGGL
jgi:DNA polymerase III epsilon subunit-like protein